MTGFLLFIYLQHNFGNHSDRLPSVYLLATQFWQSVTGCLLFIYLQHNFGNHSDRLPSVYLLATQFWQLQWPVAFCLSTCNIILAITVTGCLLFIYLQHNLGNHSDRLPSVYPSPNRKATKQILKPVVTNSVTNPERRFLCWPRRIEEKCVEGVLEGIRWKTLKYINHMTDRVRFNFGTPLAAS